MIGVRLRLARKKAGFSLRRLADALNGRVSAQAIGKYERNEMTPSSGVLLALAQTLDVSLSYLMDAQGLSLSGVDFRTKANTSARDRAQVETEVIEWIERYLQVERVLELDSSEWRNPLDIPRRLQRIDDAELLAEDVRTRWGLGGDPIPNVTELLEEQGLKVLITQLPQRVSGFTCLVNRDDEGEALPVIVVNGRFSLERRRLTLLHELAHRVMDPADLSEKDEEKAATRVAGALLMPRDHLIREAGRWRNRLGYREIMDLKHLYQVSGAALLVRLRDIGVITSETLTYAFQSVERGWRTEEPEPLEGSDLCGQIERPQRLERLCYRALAEGLISSAKAAELLRCSVEAVDAGMKGPG